MSLSQFFLQILRESKNVKKNKKVRLQIKSLHINVMSRNIMTLETILWRGIFELSPLIEDEMISLYFKEYTFKLIQRNDLK